MDRQMMAVVRMQEYISERLTDEITPADLARAALFSPWHAHRLFKRYVGVTPADYIRRLRLSRSALRLRDGATSVTEVAYEMGYKSVDGYQRAFFREFGFNPGEYAATPTPIQLFMPHMADDRRERDDMDARNIFIQVVDKPERRAIIKRGVKATEYFEYCEEVGCDIWDKLTSMESQCGEPVCLWLPEKYVAPGTSVYVQGVEAPAEGEINVPEGFDVIALPAAKYLMFCGEPFAEENYQDAISEVWTAMKKYNPGIINCVWDDSQPRIQLAPIGERGYIELRAIREK